jgi:hypothetical protein
MTTSSSPRSGGRDDRNESLEPHIRVQLIDSIARALPCLLQMGMLLEAAPPLPLVVRYYMHAPTTSRRESIAIEPDHEVVAMAWTELSSQRLKATEATHV